MMGHSLASRIALGCAVAVIAGASLCGAQDASAGQAPPARREFESRAEIEAQAKAAEAQHRPNEAWLLRQRLEKGDFQDGDRIIIDLHGNALMPKDFAGIPETSIVRAGRRLEFPRMADLPLDGVLRSELNDKLTEYFAQYIREPTVRSTPLVRIAVLGLVGKPGYVYTQADAPLSDVIMQAGGPGGDANMAGITIRRGVDVIWDAQDTRAALADGMSLDRLHLRAGDEIVVPQEQHFSWVTIITVTASVATLLYTLVRIR
jgi:protein involved in polysaccharide export with SLBB domain